MVAYRPLHTALKTLYHASLILPAYKEYTKYKKGEQTGRNAFKQLGHSTLDILRTPCYGTAITALHIASVILAPFSPNSLYLLRGKAGKLEKAMLRGDTNWILIPCFSPIAHIARDKFGNEQLLLPRYRLNQEAKGKLLYFQ